MTDKELLELAAKAAGIEGAYIDRSCSCGKGSACPEYYAGIQTKIGLWRPLVNDGDALRLAVKLNLLILPYPADKAVRVTPFPERNTIEQWGDDPAAATRRAIVRAAAEIGGKMP